MNGAAITFTDWENRPRPRHCFRCDLPENEIPVSLLPRLITPRRTLLISLMPPVFEFLCVPCYLLRTDPGAQE